MEKPNEIIYEAFIDCVQKNQDRFYKLAYSYVKNKETALDVVQNAVYNGLRAIHTLSEPQYVKTWFYRILVNACIDELRKSSRMIPMDPQDLPEGVVPETMGREDLLDLQHALESLDPESRTIVVLRYFEDMKLGDIAKILGENLSTVKTRLYRALEKLKVELEGDVFRNE